MSEAFQEPAAAAGRQRRMRERAWIGGILVGIFPLVGFAAASLATSKHQPSREGSVHEITTHAEPSRPALPVVGLLAARPAREESPPAQTEKAAAPPLRSRGSAARETPAPLRAVAASATKVPLPALPKSPGKAKPNPQSVEERAPRIQIIDERDSKIEVIE